MLSKTLKGAPEDLASPLAWRDLSGVRPQTLSGGQFPKPGAPADPDVLLQEAYQRGFREGEAAAQAGVGPVLERLAHSIDALAVLRVRARREAEGDLLRLAIAIARRIIHRELSVDNDAISGLIRIAMEKLQSQEVHRVRVHPDLESAVRRALESLAAGRSVQVLTDRGRLPGDVIFETSRGSLDASVESQLQEIGRGLADRLRGGA
jgi:flagellar assembly protein FliH